MRSAGLRAGCPRASPPSARAVITFNPTSRAKTPARTAAGTSARREVLVLGRFITILLLLLTRTRRTSFQRFFSCASRLAHLRRGINLSAWFAQVYDPRG